MGRRSFIASEHREWITDQLLRSGESARSPEVWRALYAAFLEQFPGACDVRGEAITQSRYRKFASYVETRQETNLASRVAAHLRRHELLQQDQKTFAEPRTHHPLEAESVESDEDMGDAEIAMKSEVVDHSDDDDFDLVVVPRAPAPLLRTRATATAVRADRGQPATSAVSPSPMSAPPVPKPTLTPTAALTPTPASAAVRPRVRREKVTVAAMQPANGVAVSSSAGSTTVVTDASRKRPRIETIDVAAVPRTREKTNPATTSEPSVHAYKPMRLSHSPKPRTEEAARQMEKEKAENAARDAIDWKAKYEAEKAANEGLHSRLSEALQLLKSQGRQLERLESAIAAATRGNAPLSSTDTSSASALTFTISVNVDVSQNGQRLRTTTHALRVDADVNADTT